MEDKYCNYTDSKWIAKFNGLKNGKLTTYIEGNTIYIQEFLEPYHETQYVKGLFGLYKKIDVLVTSKRTNIAFLVMSKCHERTLVEWLESYGFTLMINC